MGGLTLRTVHRRVAATLATLAGSVAVCACASTSSPTLAVLDARSAPAAAKANPVTVSPLPGTADASPTSQISFLGAVGTKVADVRVVGSRSGFHTGVVRAYSTRTGESFLPSSPFVAGEQVIVHARVGIGTPTRPASTTFAVAHQAAVSEVSFPSSPGDPRAIQRYSSAPSLTPSTVTITTPARPSGTPGYLFLAPYQGQGSPGPMIVDQNGSLVWFHPLPAGEVATNFGVQRYRGKPVLSWWQGRVLQLGFGEGEDVLYDSSYRPLAVIKAGNGYHADLHGLRLTPQGTAWVDAFDPIHIDLSSVHGVASGVLTDSVVQEIDVETGLVMWEWHALGHIPVRESNQPTSGNSYPWDYAHVNSVDPGTRNDVVLSARSTWAVYDVDIHTGATIWRLGGNHSSFKLGPGARFYWQHDAEFQPGGMVSLFDNGSSPPKEPQSRGLLLALDPGQGVATLVKQLVNPTHKLLASSQGNAVSLPDGSWLLGYGGLPNFTELDASGRVLLDGTLGREVQSFSTFLAPWRGHPTAPPAAIAQRAGKGALAVAASWNGATDVASWRVLAGASPKALTGVASSPKTGFQTMIAARAAGPYVVVQALDGAGRVLGTSATVRA